MMPPIRPRPQGRPGPAPCTHVAHDRGRVTRAPDDRWRATAACPPPGERRRARGAAGSACAASPRRAASRSSRRASTPSRHGVDPRLGTRSDPTPPGRPPHAGGSPRGSLQTIVNARAGSLTGVTVRGAAKVPAWSSGLPRRTGRASLPFLTRLPDLDARPSPRPLVRHVLGPLVSCLRRPQLQEVLHLET